MHMQRRQVIGAAIGGAFAAALAPQGAARAAEAPLAEKFVKPTADKPFLACFNENPLGLSMEARAAVAKSAAVCNRYPFARAEALRKACADFVGGKPEEIVLSQGSAEAIRASVESYAHEPGATLIIPELTYSDGADTARKNNVKVVTVPMGAKWSVDLEAMKKTVAGINGPVIVYFVNPNNPTSTIVDSKALHDWIRSRPADVFFVIDEAYAGDIIGVFDPGLFAIGDTITVPGKKFRYSGIPTFEPEHFMRVSPKDTMKRKQFIKGTEQIAQEGAIQIFKIPGAGLEEVIVGVVGTLQFDVFEYRMKNEYNVDLRMTSLPYDHLRLIESMDCHPDEIVLCTGAAVLQDFRDRYLLAFDGEWSVGFLTKHNPGLVLADTLSV